MTTLTRRSFLKTTAAASVGVAAVRQSLSSDERASKGGNLHLAPFVFDVTPPLGHSLCGGWIRPVLGYDDKLDAIGLVILGAGKPIVLCTVDWLGLLNDAHNGWREALAEAAGTTPERVAVHCVHQHNAPLACLNAEKIVSQYGDLPHVVDVDFFRRCLDRARESVAEAIPKARAVTRIAYGQAKVEKVASNRRVYRDDKGVVIKNRSSSCTDPQLRALPEGLIDPWLKTVAFYNGNDKLAACHYYATHPMSYYGDGRVSSDFAGLARRRRQQDEPSCAHLYFTGCAGNIAAGKYNDGSKGNRRILMQRVYDGIVGSETRMQSQALENVAWRTVDFLPPPRPDLDADELAKQIADRNNPLVSRNRPSYPLAWLQRYDRHEPITLSALHLDNIVLLHLSAEPFIQFQLRAQEFAPTRFVATAGYGDGGPWYFPTCEQYSLGGYEVRVAWSDPMADGLLTEGIRQLVG